MSGRLRFQFAYSKTFQGVGYYVFYSRDLSRPGKYLIPTSLFWRAS